MPSDEHYMARALDLAEHARGATSPNPMVGAVIVREDGSIVGQGFHERAGGPHAEVRALDEAGERARGASLFCTLEPCSHVGRTGPCVERIVSAGIARVVAASLDPNPLVAGSGIRFLRDHGISVAVGPGLSRALRLNRPYFTYITKRRPLVIVKAATSLDNRVSRQVGASTRISAPESIDHAHAIRAEVDAIGVGSETVLVDDPQLTARGPKRRRPLTRVIFDRRLRTLPSARLFSTLDAGPVIIVTTPESLQRNPAARRALEGVGAWLEPIAGGTLTAALQRLGDREVTSLLLEGGPTLQRAAAAADLVDAVHLYVAPDPIGPGGVSWLEPHELGIAGLLDRRVVPCGPDVFMEGYVHGID